MGLGFGRDLRSSSSEYSGDRTRCLPHRHRRPRGGHHQSPDDPPAPSAGADDGSHLELLKAEGEGLAIAAALAVDEAGHVTAEGMRRYGINIAVAGAANGQNLPVQVSQDHRRHVAGHGSSGHP